MRHMLPRLLASDMQISLLLKKCGLYDDYDENIMTRGKLLEWTPRLSERAWFMGSMGAGAFRFQRHDHAPQNVPLGRDTDIESSLKRTFFKVNDILMCVSFFNDRRPVFPIEGPMLKLELKRFRKAYPSNGSRKHRQHPVWNRHDLTK